jgi:hypothetical protein
LHRKHFTRNPANWNNANRNQQVYDAISNCLQALTHRHAESVGIGGSHFQNPHKFLIPCNKRNQDQRPDALSAASGRVDSWIDHRVLADLHTSRTNAFDEQFVPRVDAGTQAWGGFSGSSPAHKIIPFQQSDGASAAARDGVGFFGELT